MVKNPPTNAGDARDKGWILWVWKILWRRKQQPAPVFLPGEFYGQRSLAAMGWQRVGHNRSHMHADTHTSPRYLLHFLPVTEYNTDYRDLPDSPGVKTLGFQCKGHGFNPWLGN